jgi:hypothetical protein
MWNAIDKHNTMTKYMAWYTNIWHDIQISTNDKCMRFEIPWTKKNVYLPTLMMKVPNHFYVFNLYCLSYSAFFCLSANLVSVEVDACSSNLRFNLYCLAYSAFIYFLTASMLVSAILVTRSAYNVILY